MSADAKGAIVAEAGRWASAGASLGGPFGALVLGIEGAVRGWARQQNTAAQRFRCAVRAFFAET